jgi:hypothetical protein
MRLESKTRKLRVNFEKAAMLCLDAMKRTNTDGKENLQVFYHRYRHQAQNCNTCPKAHSWVRLLQDKSANCTMAAFGDSSLECKQSRSVSCGGTGRSVVKISIVTNAYQLPLE